MANIEIKLSNSRRIMSAWKTAPEQLKKELQIAINKTGGYATVEVKRIIKSGVNMWKAPLDTGVMRRGIQVRNIQPMKVTIMPSNITPYAIYVHEGTRKMRKRPFFDITIDQKKKNIQDFFQKATDNTLKRLAIK